MIILIKLCSSVLLGIIMLKIFTSLLFYVPSFIFYFYFFIFSSSYSSVCNRHGELFGYQHRWSKQQRWWWRHLCWLHHERVSSVFISCFISKTVHFLLSKHVMGPVVLAFNINWNQTFSRLTCLFYYQNFNLYFICSFSQTMCTHIYTQYVSKVCRV